MRFEMQNHASKYQFEEAEKIKRKIKNIENFQSKSVVVDSNLTSLGVLNIVSHEKYAFVNAIQVMNGAITKSKTTVGAGTAPGWGAAQLARVAPPTEPTWFGDLRPST